MKVKQIPLISKKQKILIAIASILVVLAGWWAYVNFMPHPLGDNLEYVGKRDYGCPLICDANPGSTYYYGTDMTPEEVVEYFNGARLEYPIEQKSEYTDIWLRNDSLAKSADIYYYDNSAAIARLKSTAKKYLIGINAENYDMLNKSIHN